MGGTVAAREECENTCISTHENELGNGDDLDGEGDRTGNWRYINLLLIFGGEEHGCGNMGGR